MNTKRGQNHFYSSLNLKCSNDTITQRYDLAHASPGMGRDEGTMIELRFPQGDQQNPSFGFPDECPDHEETLGHEIVGHRIRRIG